jgi:transcriptional regulator with XRE-family HTH domain
MVLERGCRVDDPSFGQIIAEARRKVGLSQKQLASMVTKENGVPISPQYLNDLEHDRRNPPPDYLITQFARALNLEHDYLMLAAGKVPRDIRAIGVAKPKVVEEAFRLFRKSRK